MSGSVEIVLWLHEYEFKALKKQLASNGTKPVPLCNDGVYLSNGNLRVRE